ncbi:DUF4432 family protein [Conexibacter arvalis]|uniref:DUF4432 family protein n=1 Tax=Conexibacter arvalis TaxID=912552 RepID=A0A840IF58_9ACTN|nr:DUF4432 family protein [Conexibacter arvalis]MBB4662833.1 hypothetical protein [Conexibacter arvalis]
MALHRLRRNHGARVSEAEVDGMALVTLENEPLRLTVLAGKGADVIELLYKPLDLDLCWAREQPLANPARRPPSGHDDVATYLDWYPGGWQEVLPSAGAPSAHAGAAFGQHGEAHLAPWDHEIVTDTPAEVAVRFRVRLRRLPLLLERTMTLRAGEPVVRVRERLVNEGAVEQRAMWGWHVVFGAPFLEPGMRIRLPDGTRVLPHPDDVALGGRRIDPGDGAPFAWPLARAAARLRPAAGASHGAGEPLDRPAAPPGPGASRAAAAGEPLDRPAAPPGPGASRAAAAGEPLDLSVIPPRGEPSEMLYLDVPEGWYELGRPGKPAFRLDWDRATLPWLWLWQELGATDGWPWFGDAWVVGLEPCSSQPTNGLAEAVANETALRLPPRAERTLAWSATVLPDGLSA